MKVMRRSRWLARLAAMLAVGVAGLVVTAPAPAQAETAIQANVMAAWGHGLPGDGAGWYRHQVPVTSAVHEQ